MKCFKFNLKNNNLCGKKECRYWINCNAYNNCAINASSIDKHLTLKEIGKIFNITRMRVCQIEKKAIQKIKEKIKRKD